MWKIKEWFLHYKEAIRVSLLALFRWTLLAVCTGVLCGGIGTLFHLAVEWVTEQRTEHVWLLWLLPAAGIAITALYKATGCVGKGTRLELSFPQRLQRWMMAHSPPLRTQTATGSMMPPKLPPKSHQKWPVYWGNGCKVTEP